MVKEIAVAVGTSIFSLSAMAMIMKLLIFKANKEQFEKDIQPQFDDFKELFIKNNNEHIDLKKELYRIGKQLDEHNKTLTRFTDNESFYLAISKAIKDNIPYVEEFSEAVEFLQFQGDTVKQFSRWLLDLKFQNVTVKMIETKALEKLTEGKKKLSELLGEDFAEEYFNRYGVITQEFISQIKNILQDSINNRSIRYRVVALNFLFNINSSFIKEFLGYEKSKN